MPGAAARAMPMGIALQLLFTGLGIGSIYARYDQAENYGGRA
jgi:hypothetical protein